MTTTSSSTTTTTTDPMAWATPGTIALIVIGVIALILVLRLIAGRRRETTMVEHRVEPPVVAAPAPVALAPEVAVPPVAEFVPVAPAIAPIDAPMESDAVDDLTRMKGVGPKLAVQLAGLGYTRFDQIAALSPADAAALDAQLGSFKGRLTRDRWIEQAEYLASRDTAGFETAFGRL